MPITQGEPWSGEETLGPDSNIPDVTPIAGVLATQVARRILSKATKRQGVDGEEWVTHSYDAFKLFTPKEKARAAMGKIGVASFRALTQAAPPVLGRFCHIEDAFIFTLPRDDVEREALRSFANTTVDSRTLVLCPIPFYPL